VGKGIHLRFLESAAMLPGGGSMAARLHRINILKVLFSPDGAKKEPSKKKKSGA
jgi:hypothetical protein